jgi:hypothetical protein
VPEEAQQHFKISQVARERPLKNCLDCYGVSFLPMYCTENSIYVFPEKELRGLVSSFYMHASVSDLFLPRIGRHISCSQTDPGNI